jgi:hypothetical protein
MPSRRLSIPRKAMARRHNLGPHPGIGNSGRTRSWHQCATRVMQPIAPRRRPGRLRCWRLDGTPRSSQTSAAFRLARGHRGGEPTTPLIMWAPRGTRSDGPWLAGRLQGGPRDGTHSASRGSLRPATRRLVAVVPSSRPDQRGVGERTVGFTLRGLSSGLKRVMGKKSKIAHDASRS